MGDKKGDAAKQPARQLPMLYHGLFGGTAGAIGICIVQPADLIKTRMQLKGKHASMVGTIWEVIRNEGPLRLFTGISCSVFRQYTYGLTRFFVYYNLYEGYKRSHDGEPPFLPLKMAMGCLAGMCGGFMGNPAEVALIRITGDGLLPPEKRRNYRHVFDAIFRIIREEGFFKLWRGVEATIVRCATVNTFELASYTQARELLLPYMGEGVPLHSAASMVAGFFATVSSLPVDIVKTRVQQHSGQLSQITVLKELVQKEGVLKLWSGFIPTYVKLGPHALFTFVILEQFLVLYWKFHDAAEPKYA